MLEQEKITLRKALRRQRAQLTREQVTAASEAVARQILACDAFRKAKSVMGFLAFGKELSVDAVLAAALAMGKTVAVPHIVSDTSFVPVRLNNMQDFELDRYGIRTVRPPLEEVAPPSLDLVLVPGVAFGKDGSRMGMGAGYYDRFLPQAKQAVTMGVAYACLMQESLLCDEHDVKMQCLVSESGIITLAPL
ncbi:MAG: 5-formyltetrahydrofolate cyclo-ligase [Phascolarctobacterium sp.]